MANIITFYDDDFSDRLRNLKSTKKVADATDSVTKLTKRIARMADSGAGITRIDLERYIGNNDLLRFNYLSRGLSAGKAVCRIYIADKFGGGGSWGTGFLITPGLLITNHHVIPDESSAERAFAEFGYEADNNGLLQQGKRFKLLPLLTFVTSDVNELDITIVAVAPVADDAVTGITEYGFLRMNPGLNKVEEYEFVSIIQHPGGDEKYISIRENKVIKIGDKDPVKDTRIWYECDTAHGSSGSAVFNDQWQVVAVHHSGVAESKKDDDGNTLIQLTNDEWVPKADEARYSDDVIKYVANEGIRTSRIVTHIKDYVSSEENQTKNLVLLQEFLDDVLGIKAITPGKVKESIVSNELLNQSSLLEAAKGKNIWPASHYIGRLGYVENFLGATIPFPTVTAQALSHGRVTQVSGTTDNILRYMHYSVIHNTDRKIAFVTAVNIDGSTWANIKRGDDKWYYDGRIPVEVQLGEELYSDEPASIGKKGYFDRGHLVRRQDPDWGTAADALIADEDTFHWTNCSPQYWEFNQGKEIWQGLENYILYNTDKENIKASVFTGPVFDANDTPHRGVKIPQQFFKVIAVIDSGGTLYSSAYVVSQQKWAANIPFEVLPVGDFNHFQTTIAKIEEATGLDFGSEIKKAEVKLPQNADVKLRSLADVVNPRR